MKHTKVFFLIACGLLLQACANPAYKFSEGEKTAKIKVLYPNTVTICTDRAVYDLRKNPKQNFYLIPADKRLDISSTGSYSGYQVTYYCLPKLSFIPEAGKTYVLDFSVIGDHCVLDLAQEDTSSKTGLAPELSIDAPVCFAQ